MNLTLIFNGLQTSPSQLLSVVSAAGANTSFMVTAAQTISPNEWDDITQALGNNNLTAEFNGAQTTLAVMQQFLVGAGANTNARLNSGSYWTATDLESLANAAADSKNLSVIFPGNQTELWLVESFLSAAGANSQTILSIAQNWSTSDLQTLANNAGNKQVRAEFAANIAPLALIQSFVSAAGSNSQTFISNADNMSSNDLVSLANTAGGKQLNAVFSAALSTLTLIESFVSAAGANTRTTVTSADNLSSSDLQSLASTTGSKLLTVDFEADESLLSFIQPFAISAGANTEIGLGIAQAWTDSDLESLDDATGSKPLSVTFNAVQTPLSKIQTFVTDSGINTQTTMNTAQAWPLNDLISLVTAVG